MKTFIAACLIVGSITTVPAHAQDFLTHRELLKPDEHFAGDLAYFTDGVLEKLPRFDSLMIDEPVVFLADDSDYKGFKASDLAALSAMLRESLVKGLTTQPVSIGNFKVVEEPGPSVLYVRMALTNLYVQKEKRGLLSYTPVGVVAHGVHDLASDVVDKTKLVEMVLEIEMQDSSTGEVLMAGILDRGHRKDKQANQRQEMAGWDAPGSVAEKLGRRLACRLDNARLEESKRADCVKLIPIEG